MTATHDQARAIDERGTLTQYQLTWEHPEGERLGPGEPKWPIKHEPLPDGGHRYAYRSWNREQIQAYRRNAEANGAANVTVQSRAVRRVISYGEWEDAPELDLELARRARPA